MRELVGLEGCESSLGEREEGTKDGLWTKESKLTGEIKKGNMRKSNFIVEIKQQNVVVFISI